ncbi:MAG: cytochrome c5 family protein [Gammaproteobacteria bacterium]
MKRVANVLMMLLVSTTTLAKQELMTPEAIESRIKPVGEVNISGETSVAPQQVAPQAPGPDTGKKRYDQFCSVCHAQGVAGAPKFGDKAAWAPRIAQGLDTLVKNAISGIRAMPPKGTCMSCSDEEMKLTVEYMVDHAK